VADGVLLGVDAATLTPLVQKALDTSEPVVVDFTLATLRLVLPSLIDPAAQAAAEAVLKRPLAAAVEAWSTELWPFQVKLAGEARTLRSAAGG